MVYIVEADGTSDDEVLKTAADRREARAIAVEWACQGATNIRIIGDGRIYTPEALAAAIINAGF